MRKHETNAQARENMKTANTHAIQPVPSAGKHATISFKNRKMRNVCFDYNEVKILDKNVIF